MVRRSQRDHGPIAAKQHPAWVKHRQRIAVRSVILDEYSACWRYAQQRKTVQDEAE
jgi:hypothetical protein